jgi:hypothetical protein
MDHDEWGGSSGRLSPSPEIRFEMPHAITQQIRGHIPSPRPDDPSRRPSTDLAHIPASWLEIYSTMTDLLYTDEALF